ncbi:hypothetical protein KA005_17245, partial [bacterium]|nr:hypothetical protein [bacterium]
MPDELRLNRKISNLGIGQHSRKRLDNNRLIGADARAEGKKYISADISTILNKNRIHQPMQFGGSFTSESQVVEYLSNIVRPYNSMGTHLCRLDDPPCIEGSEWVDIHSIPQKKRIKDNIEKMSKNTAMEEERLEKEKLEKEREKQRKLHFTSGKPISTDIGGDWIFQYYLPGIHYQQLFYQDDDGNHYSATNSSGLQQRITNYNNNMVTIDKDKTNIHDSW